MPHMGTLKATSHIARLEELRAEHFLNDDFYERGLQVIRGLPSELKESGTLFARFRDLVPQVQMEMQQRAIRYVNPEGTEVGRGTGVETGVRAAEWEVRQLNFEWILGGKSVIILVKEDGMYEAEMQNPATYQEDYRSTRNLRELLEWVENG